MGLEHTYAKPRESDGKPVGECLIMAFPYAYMHAQMGEQLENIMP